MENISIHQISEGGLCNPSSYNYVQMYSIVSLNYVYIKLEYHVYYISSKLSNQFKKIIQIWEKKFEI